MLTLYYLYTILFCIFKKIRILIPYSFQENAGLHSSSEAVNEEESKKNPDESSQEPNNACAEKEQQPFRDEKECLKRKVRRKNENYRRLKMKKCYVHGTSLAKKNFRKWRKTHNKR